MEFDNYPNISYYEVPLGHFPNYTAMDNKTFIPPWRNDIQERVDYFFSQPHFIFSLVLGSATLIANAASILAICHIRRTFTTHMRLIVSLNAADLLVSISVLLSLFNKLFNPTIPFSQFMPEERLISACMVTFIFALHQMATLISILNIMAMAVDHYMAVIEPLVYLTQRSKRKWVWIIIIMWLVSFIGGFSGFLSGIQPYQQKSHLYNYCECITTFGDYHPEFVTWTVALVAAFTITFVYIRISCEVCYVNSQMSNVRQGYIKNKKAIRTTLFIIATFVICWLPTCFFQVIMIGQVYANKYATIHRMRTLIQVNKYLNHLYLSNSLLDPIIYAFRLREMQLGYRLMYARCRTCACCCGNAKRGFGSSFRRDFTTMTSTAERGYLVIVPDSRLPRHESCRLVFPHGRRFVHQRPPLQRTYSDPRCFQNQRILMQDIINSRTGKSKPNGHLCNTSNRSSKSDKSNSDSSMKNNNSAIIKPGCKNDDLSDYKENCYQKDFDSETNYSNKGNVTNSTHLITANGQCTCTTSV